MSGPLAVVYIVGALCFAAMRYIAGSVGNRSVVASSAMWTGLAGLAGSSIGLMAHDREVALWSLLAVAVAALFLVAMIWPEKGN